jgi:hypothetical protein
VFGHVVDAVKEVASPAVERAGGFRTTSYRVGQEIGAATRQNAGRADLAAMEMLSQAGIGGGLAGAISPSLAAMGSVRGGVEAYQRQSDILHAAQYARSQSRQYGGYDENLFRNVGGIGIDLGPFHTAIGGSASFQEKLANDLGVLPEGPMPEGQTNAGVTGRTQPRADSNVLKSQVEWKDALKKGQEVIALFNQDVARGSGGLSKLSLATEKTTADLTRQTAMYEAAGLGDLGRRLEEEGIATKGLEGMTEDQATKALRQMAQDAVTGAAMPDTGLYLERQKALEIPNRYTSMSMQRENMRKFGMQNWGFAQAQAPMLGSPLLEAFGKAGLGGGTPLAGQQAESRAAEVNRQAAAQAEALKQNTIATLKMPTGPGSEAEKFSQAFDTILSTGKQISALQFDLGARQAALTVAQLNNELRLTNRALADAKGLAGMAGGSKYGQVQREQWQLGRESQQIGFQLTERQLNMQEAVIGFGVSGESPQERGARMEEAKLRLKLERQQLAISKKQYGNEGYLFQEGAERGVTDTAAQKALLEQGIKLQFDTENINKQIEALQVKMTTAMSQVSGPIEQAQSFAGTLVTDLEAFANAFKVIMTDFVGAFYATWGQGAPGTYGAYGPGRTDAPGTRGAAGASGENGAALGPIGQGLGTQPTLLDLLAPQPKSWVPGKQGIASAQGYKPSTVLPTPGGAMAPKPTFTEEAGGQKQPNAKAYNTAPPVGQAAAAAVSTSTVTTVNVGGLSLSMNVDGASIEDVQKLLNDGASEIVQKVQDILTQKTRHINGRAMF